MAYKRCWQCSKDVLPSTRYYSHCGADQWELPQEAAPLPLDRQASDPVTLRAIWDSLRPTRKRNQRFHRARRRRCDESWLHWFITE